MLESVLFALLPSIGVAATSPIPSALAPRRALTAGGYDHFHGELSPDGQTLYFVGNDNSTKEIFVQNLTRGFPKALFDESADVAQPRVSPDGKKILYISYREDAGGDACIYHIKKQRRRCLTKRGIAVLYVFWLDGGTSVGALTRTSLTADHQLRRFHPSKTDQDGELLVERNMSAPTVSPDGRWLVYVPLDREKDAAVQGRLLRASPGLLLQRLDQPHEPIRFEPDLPGASSFPAFGASGKHLYFTQYLNDTNFDGVTDAEDNGVLFRVPFGVDSNTPVQPQTYQQLTSGGTNCQYPAPAQQRLVATCVRAGYLQIYSIPLHGVVPYDWPKERMEAEIEASRNPFEQLLLLRQLIPLSETPEKRLALYRRMIMHHIGLKEYESADYYLGLLDRMPGIKKSPLATWIFIQRELVAHRREEQRLAHGKLNRDFVAAQKARLQRLDPLLSSEQLSTRRLARLAESEIHLVLGEKAAAIAMFDAIDITQETDLSVLQVWARQGEALYRDLGDRTRWMKIHRQLARHSALQERERLYHAGAFVKVLRRGRSYEESLPALQEARGTAADEPELQLMLDLEIALLRVPLDGEDKAKDALEHLWNSAPTFERHRAVAMGTIARAVQKDWARLVHVFGQRWLEDVPVEHPEYKYAQTLYAEAMFERAYVELHRGNIQVARALFKDIFTSAESLEAHVGYIESAFKLGYSRESLMEEYDASFPKESPVAAFAKAYLMAAGLSEIVDSERHAKEVERERTLLRPAALELPRSPEIHHLYAYLAHRHYHRTGDKPSAMAANTRYHLALDLAPNDPRKRANLLVELGLLQASLGNHRIALRYFSERERYPFLEPEGELAFALAKARSLFHAASYLDAKSEMDHALQVAADAPELRKYVPVVLDRAALYYHAAGAHERAVELYSQLVDVVADRSLAARMKARLGLGAAALAAGQFSVAREALEEACLMLDSDEAFRQGTMARKAASHFERKDYRPLVVGLLAQAHRASADWPAAIKALQERRALYQGRFETYGRDQYLLEMAGISQQLAEAAFRLKNFHAARKYIEEGLAYADTWRRRTNTEIEEVTLALLRAAAELCIYGDVPRASFGFDVFKRLEKAYELITLRPNPKWSDERFLFPLYLSIFAVQ